MGEKKDKKKVMKECYEKPVCKKVFIEPQIKKVDEFSAPVIQAAYDCSTCYATAMSCT